jgi:hypothetical protein
VRASLDREDQSFVQCLNHRLVNVRFPADHSTTVVFPYKL